MLDKLIRFFKNKKYSNIKKKTLYLHIGMGKTGTTALQEFFWENRNILQDDFDITYPEYGSVSYAHHLLSPHIPPFMAVDWTFLRPEEWCPEMVAASSDKILVSSELIAWASAEMIAEFSKEVTKWFDVKVVIYLRRQDNLIMAGYNQQIKAGSQKRHINDVVEGQFDRFDYKKKLQPWINAWGEENIIVRPFEREQFYHGDIRYDFLYRVFGIDDFEKFSINDDGDNPNPRLSLKAMEYKRWINNIITDTAISSQFNKVLLEYSAETDENSTSVFSTNLLLSPRKRMEILDRCEHLNSEIARRFLKREDGKLFYEPAPMLNSGWNDCTSLNSSEKAEITDYIRNREPELYGLLGGVQTERSDHSPLEDGINLSSFGAVKKKKLIVHIGMHKTGSSAVQNTLYSHDIFGGAFGYLHFGRPNSSLVIGQAFLGKEQLVRRFGAEYVKKGSQVRQDILKKIGETILSFEQDKLILSAEVISVFNKKEITDFFSFFKIYFESIEFCAYMREPVSYGVSAFQETLKRRYVGLESKTFKHVSLIEILDKLVGQDNVKVFIFDKSYLPNGDVVRHFFSQVLDNIYIGEKHNLDVNNSLSLNSIKFLYLYRKELIGADINVGHPGSLQKFLSLLALDGDAFGYSSALAAKVKEKNEHFYEWIFKRTGKEFKEYEPESYSGGVSCEDDLLDINSEELNQFNFILNSCGLEICQGSDVGLIAQKIHQLRESVIS